MPTHAQSCINEEGGKTGKRKGKDGEEKRERRGKEAVNGIRYAVIY